MSSLIYFICSSCTLHIQTILPLSLSLFVSQTHTHTLKRIHTHTHMQSVSLNTRNRNRAVKSDTRLPGGRRQESRPNLNFLLQPVPSWQKNASSPSTDIKTEISRYTAIQYAADRPVYLKIRSNLNQLTFHRLCRTGYMQFLHIPTASWTPAVVEVASQCNSPFVFFLSENYN